MVQLQGVHGPYLSSVRAKILEDLLKAQKEIREEDPNMILITQQELIAIQIIWYRDGIFYPRVADIYNKIYNFNDFDMDKQEIQKQKEDELLEQVCQDYPQDVQLINNLLDLHKSKILLKNKRGLTGDLEKELENHLKRKASA